MPTNIGKRLKRGLVNVQQGRVVSPQEHADREANEEANRIAQQANEWMKQQVRNGPMESWFPSDTNGTEGGSWVPNFFTFGRDDR
jgi:hypothetical protein